MSFYSEIVKGIIDSKYDGDDEYKELVYFGVLEKLKKIGYHFCEPKEQAMFLRVPSVGSVSGDLVELRSQMFPLTPPFKCVITKSGEEIEVSSVEGNILTLNLKGDHSVLGTEVELTSMVGSTSDPYYQLLIIRQCMCFAFEHSNNAWLSKEVGPADEMVKIRQDIWLPDIRELERKYGMKG